jgi:hypothetical protein
MAASSGEGVMAAGTGRSIGITTPLGSDVLVVAGLSGCEAISETPSGIEGAFAVQGGDGGAEFVFALRA